MLIELLPPGGNAARGRNIRNRVTCEEGGGAATKQTIQFLHTVTCRRSPLQSLGKRKVIFRLPKMGVSLLSVFPDVVTGIEETLALSPPGTDVRNFGLAKSILSVISMQSSLMEEAIIHPGIFK